ncbi:MAG: AEC family transporter [Gammaproteobacteria bacterium]
MLIDLIEILFIIGLGWYTGRKGWFNDQHLDGFEAFLFKISLPCLLFSATHQALIQDLIYWPFIANFCLSFLIVAVLIALVFAKRYPLPQILMKVLTGAYVNSAFYGLPVMKFILDDPRAAVTANLIQALFINSSFMIALSFLTEKGQNSLPKKLFGIVSSPIIVLPILGIIIAFFEIPTPKVITKISSNLGICAPALALFSFGLNLNALRLNFKVFKNWELSFIVACKNILHPVLAYGLGAYFFHLSEYWLKASVIMCIAPTAFIINIMAKRFQVDAAFVKSGVAITSFIAVFSLILMIFLF